MLCVFFPVLVHRLFGLLTMASAADVDAVIRAAEPDLTFLLEDDKVPKIVQHDLITKGWDTLRMFARIDDSKQDLRKTCVNILHLDQMTLEGKRATTMLIDAWVAANLRIDAEERNKAEARALGTPRFIQTSLHGQMRSAVEKIVGVIPADEFPSKDYLQKKMDEVEDSEPTASPLDEIVSMKAQKDSEMVQRPDAQGFVRRVRIVPKTSFPAGPMEYQKRMLVERNLWLALALKFSNRWWLRDLAEKSFERLVK